MTALLLVAHGSRHPGTAGVLEGLADAVRMDVASDGHGHATGGDGPSSVRMVWLELIEPSLEQVCVELAATGEHSAVIVPLLFTEAFHRRVDLPEQTEAATAATGVSLEIRNGLMLGAGVRDALLQRIGDTSDDILVMAVGSSSTEANDAVHTFAADLDARLPGHVTAAFTVAAPPPLGIDAVEIAANEAAARGNALTVVPLFTAPGLLWDAVVDRAPERELACDVRFLDPLGDLLTDVVVSRWTPDQNP